MKCPECGAENVGENTCETRYHEFLVREFTDPGYGAVHHLTVAAYMLQHSSKLSIEGWLETRNLLREFLIVNRSPAEIRRRSRQAVNNDQRKWKIASKDNLPKISRTAWTRTIMDVKVDNAEVYCADVTAWARAALMDGEEIT